MPGPTSIPTTADLDGNEDPDSLPPDLGGNDITDFDCGATTLIDLNSYVKEAHTQAASILAIMSGSLNSIQSKKASTEAELANASTTFTTFQTAVATANNDALPALNSILTDQTAALSDTINAAADIKNIFAGITIGEATAEELTLLIEEARALLPAAEAHLASTLSYKNDLYTEVANIEASVDSEAVAAKAAIDTYVAAAQTTKASAEAMKVEMDFRFTEFEILYGHTHGNTYYTATDADGCYISPPIHTQDLTTEWDEAVEYVVDAGNLIE